MLENVFCAFFLQKWNNVKKETAWDNEKGAFTTSISAWKNKQ